MLWRLTKILSDFGAQEQQVDELFPSANSNTLGPEDFVTISLEIEAFPEPRDLNSKELRFLITKFGSSEKAAAAIGASEAFVRQNAKKGSR